MGPTGSSPGCEACVADWALDSANMGPSLRTKDCWGQVGSTWKSKGAFASRLPAWRGELETRNDGREVTDHEVR